MTEINQETQVIVEINSHVFIETTYHPSYGDCLEVKREYYQNCSVLDCVTQTIDKSQFADFYIQCNTTDWDQ